MPFKSFDDEQGEIDAATDSILNNTLVAFIYISFYAVHRR